MVPCCPRISSTNLQSSSGVSTAWLWAVDGTGRCTENCLVEPPIWINWGPGIRCVIERYGKICWNHVETCWNVLKLPISCVEIRSAAGPPFSYLRIRSTVSLNLSCRNGQGIRRRNVGNSLLQSIKFMFSIASTWGDPRQNQPRTGSTAQRIQIKEVTMIQPPFPLVTKIRKSMGSLW